MTTQPKQPNNKTAKPAPDIPPDPIPFPTTGNSVVCSHCNKSYPPGTMRCTQGCGKPLPGVTLQEPAHWCECCGLRGKPGDVWCSLLHADEQGKLSLPSTSPETSWQARIDQKRLEAIDSEFVTCRPSLSGKPLYIHDKRVNMEYLVRPLQRAHYAGREVMVATDWFDELYYLSRRHGNTPLVSYALHGSPAVFNGSLGAVNATLATFPVLSWFILEALLERKYLEYDETSLLLRYCPNAIAYYKEVYHLPEDQLATLSFQFDLQSCTAGEPKDGWPVVVGKYRGYAENLLIEWEKCKQETVTMLTCGPCSGLGHPQFASRTPCACCNGAKGFPVSQPSAKQSLPPLSWPEPAKGFCPWCRASCRADAKVCRRCGWNLPHWYVLQYGGLLGRHDCLVQVYCHCWQCGVKQYRFRDTYTPKWCQACSASLSILNDGSAFFCDHCGRAIYNRTQQYCDSPTCGYRLDPQTANEQDTCSSWETARVVEGSAEVKALPAWMTS